MSKGLISEILICDDHPIFQVGLKMAFQETFPDRVFHFNMVSLGLEAVRRIKKQPPDLLVLDLRLPDISGLEVLKLTRTQLAKTKIIIMTSESSVQALSELLRYGVGAILLKSYTVATMEKAFKYIEQAKASETYLDPLLEKQLLQEMQKEPLSPREKEVLELLAKGHTNKTIASLLDCSPETVKAHCAKIRAKTRLRSRDEISAWFYRGIEEKI